MCIRDRIVSAIMMAFSHGSNDAQKAMGIITLTLLSGGFIDTLDVPILSLIHIYLFMV